MCGVPSARVSLCILLNPREWQMRASQPASQRASVRACIWEFMRAHFYRNREPHSLIQQYAISYYNDVFIHNPDVCSNAFSLGK